MVMNMLLFCLAVFPGFVTANEWTTKSQLITNNVTTEDTTVNATIEVVKKTGSDKTAFRHCGYQLTGSSGSFHTPNYPYEYPNLIDCRWSIIVNSSERIQLTFDHFSTAYYDYVIWFDGSTDNGTRIDGLPNVPFSINSTMNWMTIDFHTDRESQNIGFDASYLTYDASNEITSLDSRETRIELEAGITFRLSGQQLQVYHDGIWGTVCDHGFNTETTRSICNLIYGTWPTCVRFFNNGYGPILPDQIWLDQLQCTHSSYFSTTNCYSYRWGVHDCSHSEDIYLDCNCENTYEITTSTTDLTSKGGRIPIELVFGNFAPPGAPFTLNGQQLQVYHDGRWGTVCDDGFSTETAETICYHIYGTWSKRVRYFTGGYGPTTPNTIWLDQLECNYSYYHSSPQCTANPWGVNDCSNSEDVYLDCFSENTSEDTTVDTETTMAYPVTTAASLDTATTMAYPVATSASLDLYVRSITVDCNPDAWNIMIYLPDLYKRHTDFDPSDIYFGRPGCQGYRVGNYLRIDQQYSNCDTHHFMTFGRVEYTNTLVYAYRDPNYKFIIREYRFKIDVECDMATRETVSQHFIESHNQVRMRSNNPSISSSGHYHVHMTFYRDRGFQQQMLGNPLTVSIGQDIFVSVNTPLSDFDVKMKVDSCYTLPSPDAGNQFKFHLIKDGCTSDVNTHVLYLSSHETRFVFRDFEYDTNQDNLYLFCTATFCNVTDYSSACDQSCHSVKRRSVQSPSQNFFRRAETSEALHLSTGRSRRETGEIDETKTAGHAQYIIVDDHLFIAVIVSAVGISAIAIFVVIRRYKKPRSRPIDTI